VRWTATWHKPIPPSAPEYCREAPTASVDDFSSPVSSTTSTAWSSASSATAQQARRSRAASWYHTARDKKCCSRCGPECPSASASVQQLTRCTSISIASVISRIVRRVSRRGKQSAIRRITSPNPSRHACCATVASTATAFVSVVTNDHDRGGRTHTRDHPTSRTSSNASAITIYSCRVCAELPRAGGPLWLR
jgi:hypothetical protein